MKIIQRKKILDKDKSTKLEELNEKMKSRGLILQSSFQTFKNLPNEYETVPVEIANVDLEQKDIKPQNSMENFDSYSRALRTKNNRSQ